MHFLLNLLSLNLHENTYNYRSYMFRSSTILREHLFVVQTVKSAQQTAHTPFHDMLPHLHTIYYNVILLNVLTEV